MPRKELAGIREKCDQIWQFRLENAGAKPTRTSDDAEEAQLGRFLHIDQGAYTVRSTDTDTAWSADELLFIAVVLLTVLLLALSMLTFQ